MGAHDPKPLHPTDEIRALFASDTVRFTQDGLVLLTKIANVPGLGGLRLCARLTQVAASASKGEPIDASLLARVIRTLHGPGHGVAHIERAVAQLGITLD